MMEFKRIDLEGKLSKFENSLYYSLCTKTPEQLGKELADCELGTYIYLEDFYLSQIDEERADPIRRSLLLALIDKKKEKSALKKELYENIIRTTEMNKNYAKRN